MFPYEKRFLLHQEIIAELNIFIAIYVPSKNLTVSQVVNIEQIEQIAAINV